MAQLWLFFLVQEFPDTKHNPLQQGTPMCIKTETEALTTCCPKSWNVDITCPWIVTTSLSWYSSEVSAEDVNIKDIRYCKTPYGALLRPCLCAGSRTQCQRTLFQGGALKNEQPNMSCILGYDHLFNKPLMQRMAVQISGEDIRCMSRWEDLTAPHLADTPCCCLRSLAFLSLHSHADLLFIMRKNSLHSALVELGKQPGRYQ